MSRNPFWPETENDWHEIDTRNASLEDKTPRILHPKLNSWKTKLRLGREAARQYGGEPSDAGFVCDLFGHISQLPQILAGFGIKGGFLWRGLAPQKKANFFWEGADGTRLLCYQFGRAGYCDYDYDVRRSTQHEVLFDAERGRVDLKEFLDKESARTPLAPLIIFDGGDHLEYDEEHYRLLFEQKSGADFPYEITHSTLDGYLDDMLLHVGELQDVVRGELRDTGCAPQIPVEWGGFQERFAFELKPGFRVFDSTGKELPYQRLAQTMNRNKTRRRVCRGANCRS